MLIQERFDSSGVVWHIDGWQTSKILFLPLVLFKFSYGKFEILATKRAGSNYTRSNDS